MTSTYRKNAQRDPCADEQKATARRYHFDRWGSVLGYMDHNGHYYDKTGSCRGEVVGGRDLYDTNGVYRGHFDIQGQYWDEDRVGRGYLQMPIPPLRGRAGLPVSPATTASKTPPAP